MDAVDLGVNLFVTLFALLDPIGNLPIFAAATAGASLRQRVSVSALICVPIFAFFASGVAVNGDVFRELFTDELALGIMIGLFFGKIIGITGASVLAVKLRLAERPEGLDNRDILALSVLGAIGFTVSLLVAELALPEGEADLAKAAVLLTSVAASVIGALLLLRRGRVHEAG